jgi:methylenetetrahydrofolate dehydrogenase (NADP+)/methenyltetrahydrofolate cyclohydrolase
MHAQLLDGKALAAAHLQSLQTAVATRQRQGLRPPGLAVIQVGADAASTVYVRNKRKACADAGFYAPRYDLAADVSAAELLTLIQQLNADTTIDGVLLQLPLPPHLAAEAILEQIAPEKDVDGFHPCNLGRLAARLPGLRPCTPKGVMSLLAHTQVALAGLEAVVVGVSNIVGRPMALELLQARCTVTSCHSRTRNLAEHVARAEVLVVAVGQPRFIPGAWIRPGAIVVDVGIHRQADGTLCGDVDFATARERAGWITPVPGGVGPMTVISLLENTLLAATHAR